MSQQAITQMHTLLAALQPQHVNIIDDSHKHVGHAGARSGGGHYHLEITSAMFIGQTTVTQHRMIYSALGDMMKRDIHALQITANVPKNNER
jgi:BolA family transcriptional regulator, general stress-responsive regulator